MTRLTSYWGVVQRLLIVPPIILGLSVFVWQVQGSQPPKLKPTTETARAVRVIEVIPTDLIPTVEGFGSVQPARVWSAVVEVSGRVVEIHPKLRNGAVFTQGTRLLSIDPVDYELAIAQAHAELAELKVQEANAGALLAIELRSQQLIERESERVNNLVARGTLPQAEADQKTRSVLSARVQVQNLRNTLALIPAQRRNLETQLARTERDLQQTLITAPFDIRIAALEVEKGQYVSTGQKLFEGDSIDQIEIVAQFPMAQTRNLVLGRTDLQLDVNSRVEEVIEFYPTVRLNTGRYNAEWEAKFLRFTDTIDPQTRTIGIAVAVDDPLAKAIPNVRPPLTKGMFVSVLMRGRSQPNRILVPRSAIRNDGVYVADAGNRLQRRSVDVAFNQDDFSVVTSGLKSGDRVVISDLIPAVEGMLLEAQVDSQWMDKIQVEEGQ